MHSALESGYVLGTRVAVATIEGATERIVELAAARQRASVCFATAHMLVEATRDASVAHAYDEADLVYPDGAPVAWCLRLLGFSRAACVSGPRTFPAVLRQAASLGLRVGFYGGRPGTLARIHKRLEAELPSLQVAYCYSPPFRPLSAEEQEAALHAIQASGTQLLFIGLGSPKQELWMWRWSSSLQCVCLGVGAAFEFFSGEKKLPPLWVQTLGLTWLVRLCQEPRRLARRNLYSPVFAAMFGAQHLLGLRYHRSIPSLCESVEPLGAKGNE